MTCDLALRVDVADVGGNTCNRASVLGSVSCRQLIVPLTWSSANIVQGKLSHPRIELHQKRQWLTNAPRRSQDSDFSCLDIR